MPTPAARSIRLLPDGTPLHNRLLAALPAVDYARIQKQLHMHTGVTGRTLQAHGAPVTERGGVLSHE
jgi:predicted NAD/FAD-binding protein